MSFWSFGPLVDELLIPAAPEHGTPVSPLPNHSVSVTFANPIRGSIYGISWTWGE